jgi:hypothetical protein
MLVSCSAPPATKDTESWPTVSGNMAWMRAWMSAPPAATGVLGTVSSP